MRASLVALGLVTSLATRAEAADVEPPRRPVTVKAAFGEGVTVADPDGDLELNVRGRVQIQGFVETNEPDGHGARATPDAAFLVRRMRLLLQGHALQKQVGYYVQLGFSARDMDDDTGLPVRDAYVEWLGLRDASVRAGQMKVPFSRERLISSSSLELVDRSNVNEELNLDRDVGLQLFSEDLLGAGKRLRYGAGVFGGDGRNRVVDRAGLLWVARVEALPLGEFDDYEEADARRAAGPKLSFGVATAYNASAVRALSTTGETFTTGTVDYRHAAADVMVKWRGVSLQTEILYRKADALVVGTKHEEDGRAVDERARPALGYLAQLGALVVPDVDVAVRYGEVRPLDGDEVRRDREIGGGLGWFPRGHDLKIQADYFRLIRDDDVGPDVATDRVRVQTQLYF